MTCSSGCIIFKFYKIFKRKFIKYKYTGNDYLVEIDMHSCEFIWELDNIQVQKLFTKPHLYNFKKTRTINNNKFSVETTDIEQIVK